MTKFLNISTDRTLGGATPSDSTVSSQKAIKNYIADNVPMNTATGTDGVSLFGTSSSGNYATNIGYSSSSGTEGVALGYFASAKTTSVSVGSRSGNNSNKINFVCVGYQATVGESDTVAIGYTSLANSQYGIAIGDTASVLANSTGSIAIGYSTSIESQNAVAIGYDASVSGYGYGAVAIGYSASATGVGSIQLGHGTNTENQSLYVGFGAANEQYAVNYKLLGSTGLIPIERLGGDNTSTADKFLKENGSWSTIPGGWTPPSQTGNSGKFLTTDGSDTSWASITIPTVNNATLTIQKNGTDVATFTANSSTNTTANISVPTQASDISALDTDASNITSTGKETIVRLCLPDWSRAIAWTVGQNYTAPSDGYVLLKGNVVAYDLLDTDKTTEIQTEYWLSQSYTTTEFHPVAKGQYIKYRHGGQTYSAFKFIPFKGV